MQRDQVKKRCHYSVTKKNALLINTTWMNLQEVLLSENKCDPHKLLYDSICTVYLKRQNYRNGDQFCQGLEMRVGGGS